MVNWYKLKGQTSRRVKVRMSDMAEYVFRKDNPMGTPVGEIHEKELLENPNYTFEKQDSKEHKDRKKTVEGGLLDTAIEKLPSEVKGKIKEATKKSSKKGDY